jgi:hypothetical protein
MQGCRYVVAGYVGGATIRCRQREQAPCPTVAIRMLEAVFAVSLAWLAGGGPWPNAENRPPGSRTLSASGAAPTGATGRGIVKGATDGDG